MPPKTKKEVSQEQDIVSLLSELRSKLEESGDKSCLSILDKLDTAVAAESGEEEQRPFVDSSMQSPEEEEEEEEEAAETSDEEAVEPAAVQEAEADAGTEKPVAKKKYPVEEFNTEGM